MSYLTPCTRAVVATQTPGKRWRALQARGWHKQVRRKNRSAALGAQLWEAIVDDVARTLYDLAQA